MAGVSRRKPTTRPCPTCAGAGFLTGAGSPELNRLLRRVPTLWTPTKTIISFLGIRRSVVHRRLRLLFGMGFVSRRIVKVRAKGGLEWKRLTGREAIAKNELVRFELEWDLVFDGGSMATDTDSCICIITHDDRVGEREIEISASEADVRTAVRTIVETLRNGATA